MIEFMAVTLAQWGTAARTLVAQLRGRGAQGQNDTAEPFDGVEVAQPMGLRVNPVLRDSLEGVVVEIGDERYVLCLIDKSLQTGAVEPETGGTVLHGCAAPDAVVYVRANGDIEVTPKTGQSVKLAGGAQPFVKGTLYADALGAFLDGLTTVMTAIGVFATAVGPGVPVAGPAAAVTLNAAIVAFNSIVATFKASRATYLSIIVGGA